MVLDCQQIELGICHQLHGVGLIAAGGPGTPEEKAGVFLLRPPWANYVGGQVLNASGAVHRG